MGQIGAKYLRRWSSFVLDPFNERVWLKAVRLRKCNGGGTPLPFNSP
jgi:hypothetical protein